MKALKKNYTVKLHKVMQGHQEKWWQPLKLLKKIILQGIINFLGLFSLEAIHTVFIHVIDH
jgi:hypothetical protein